MTQRGLRKTEVGVVTSNKMHKTIVVKVERYVRHPKFGKLIKKFTTYKAHDENNQAKIGDLVEIVETRPLSKTKRFRLFKVLKKFVALEAPPVELPAIQPDKPPVSSQGESQL